ncbi:MAG TPA: hypothetical protein VEY12_04530 [Thermoplasmata archaeon]|nr:hypothetical protein [Thermoplasmata archaeon]
MASKGKDALEAWKAGGDLDAPLLDAATSEFQDLLRVEYALAQQLAKAGRIEEATSQLLQTNAFASAVAQKRPSLVTKLGSVIADLRAALSALANALGAAHFSVTVGFPGDVSVTLTFDLKA